MTDAKETDAQDQRVARMAEVLSAAVRVAGRSRLSLEREMELSSGYLSKILGGTVELRMRHVFMILDALNVDPAVFFRVAFPQRQSSPVSRTAQRLMEDVGAALAREPDADTGIPEADFDDQVKRSLARLLGLGTAGG